MAYARAATPPELPIIATSEAASLVDEGLELLTPRVAARRLGVSQLELYRMVLAGELRAFQHGDGPRAPLRIAAAELARSSGRESPAGSAGHAETGAVEGQAHGGDTHPERGT